MLSRSMEDIISGYDKVWLYNNYVRIVYNSKPYERVSKKKMVEEIFKEYSEEGTVRTICTVRELKYLKKVLNEDTPWQILLDDKYKWERETLIKKFLIVRGAKGVSIPDDIYKYVESEIEKTDWEIMKNYTDATIIFIAFVKMRGYCAVDYLRELARNIVETPKNDIDYYFNNCLFRYYVYIYNREYMNGEIIKTALDYDWFHDDVKLEKSLNKYEEPSGYQFDSEVYKSIFYNGYDVNNEVIKKFTDELEKYPRYDKDDVMSAILSYTFYNESISPVKNWFKETDTSKKIDFDKFFKLMDDAYGEMNSAALYGEQIKNEKQLVKSFDPTPLIRDCVKQKNAYMERKDFLLFNKLYSGVLDFTINKYGITSARIYRNDNVREDVFDNAVKTFWKNKEAIIFEFCLANPYNFNKEEIKLVKEFRKAINEEFVLVGYDKDYAKLLYNDNIYMVKSMTRNMDEMKPPINVPKFIFAQLFPFKDNIILWENFSTSTFDSKEFKGDLIEKVEKGKTVYKL